MSADAARLRELTLELVEVASPTGDTAEAARVYAQRLEEAGMAVELLHDAFPATPTVIGRLRGSRPGPTVVLNGHLDTVPIPHAPPRVEDDIVHGRGSADMKGACASALEAVRVLADADFAGEVAIVAIGLHEAPHGRGEDLAHLLFERGFSADYAVVCELSAHDVAVAHLGSATYEITASRPGMPTHELQTPPGTPHPIHAIARVIDEISNLNDEISNRVHPLVGSETFFVGEVHGGDFYNRYPTACRLVGTRRWWPSSSFEAVEREFRELLDGIAHETRCAIDLDLKLVRGAYEIDPDHELVGALRDAYREVTGDELEPVGVKVVADGAMFAAAGIPTVYHGPRGNGAHADEESIPVAELVRAANVYIALLRRLLR